MKTNDFKPGDKVHTRPELLSNKDNQRRGIVQARQTDLFVLVSWRTPMDNHYEASVPADSLLPGWREEEGK